MVVAFWYLYQIKWLMKLIFLFSFFTVSSVSVLVEDLELSNEIDLFNSMPLFYSLLIGFFLSFRCLWFVSFHIINHFFEHIFCCRDQWLIVIHDTLAWSFLIFLIKNQYNIFIAFAHNSLLSAMKDSSSKNIVSQKLKIYTSFRSWPP